MILAIIGLIATLAQAQQPDRYRDFQELSQNEREGADFNVFRWNRHSPVTVLAIHGGTIDSGTDRLAISLAGDDWNLYVFKGLRKDRSHDLHLTATHFDEPQALAMVADSRFCLSIHSHHVAEPRICVGGGNSALRAQTSAALRMALTPGFPGIGIETSCPGLDGVAKKNIVNRCAEGGVQLEFSEGAMERINLDPLLWSVVREAIRYGLNTSH
jgi:phage replication-related protein YjqB (UPF0714/DUF867 family)